MKQDAHPLYCSECKQRIPEGASFVTDKRRPGELLCILCAQKSEPGPFPRNHGGEVRVF